MRRRPARGRYKNGRFSSTLPTGIPADSWTGPATAPARIPFALPDFDTLFRGQVKLSVANVERLVPRVEVADDERPDRARGVGVDGQQLLEQGVAILRPPHLGEAEEEALV